MAEQTEPRLSKNVVIPSEYDKPIVDPGATDLSGADTSIDAVEATRVTRAEGSASGDASYDPESVDVTRASASLDTSYDAVEATRAARFEAEDSGMVTHAEKVDDLRNAADAIERVDAETQVEDISPGNYP